MDDLPLLIALHPVETFAGAALLVVLGASLLWWGLRWMRKPLWDLLRRAWHHGSERWPPVRRLRMPAAWQGGPLLLDLLLGFGIVVVAVAAFFEVADEIELDEGLGRFDDALAGALAREASAGTLKFFAAVTHLADAQVQWGIGIVMALALLALRQRLLALTWLVAVAGNGLLNRILKALFERSRPLHEHGFTAELGWSFPSGHTSGAVVIYGMLAYLAMRATAPAWHLPIGLAALITMLMVGYSRIVLQVHYLSDVLAAFVSGGAWLIVCIGAARMVHVHRAHRLLR